MAQLRVTAKALPAEGRQNNRSLLLQLLFHDGAMSRADLARLSGLTRVTVSALVSELIEEDLVQETGERSAPRVGKPSQLVAFHASASAVVALDLSDVDAFAGALMDLRGRVLARFSAPLDGAVGEDAVQIALGLAQQLISATDRPLLGIGIASPGVVDHAGVVREASGLAWHGVDLAGAFRERFVIPVHVANDANAAVLALYTFRSVDSADLMLVAVRHGVGAGLIVGGSLVEGGQFAGGEIGHLVIDENGEPCECGRRGCLERAIAVPHLRRRLSAADSEAERRALREEAGTALGAALAPIVSALGLSRVVLFGPQDVVEGVLLDRAAETIRARTLGASTRGLEISAVSDEDPLLLLGALGLVLAAELGIS